MRGGQGGKKSQAIVLLELWPCKVPQSRTQRRRERHSAGKEIWGFSSTPVTQLWGAQTYWHTPSVCVSVPLSLKLRQMRQAYSYTKTPTFKSNAQPAKSSWQKITVHMPFFFLKVQYRTGRMWKNLTPVPPNPSPPHIEANTGNIYDSILNLFSHFTLFIQFKTNWATYLATDTIMKSNRWVWGSIWKPLRKTRQPCYY